MADCFDQILCNQSNDCEILITDEDGLEIDTRYLHDGDIIYLRVPERIGYTLTGFDFIPNNGDAYPIVATYIGDDLYEVLAICGGTFVANFTTNIYELIVSPDDETHGTTLGSGRYSYNTVVQLSAIENTGYHFIGWYIDDELISTDINYRYTVISDAYIIGKFGGDDYSIVARPNNRILGNASGSGIYEYGTVVTLTATPFEGSIFVSWDDGDTNPTKTITVTENKIFIAIFQRESYTVTVNIINNSVLRPTETCGVVTGEGVYTYGTVVTLYASPSLGFEFISWDNGPEHLDTFTRYSFIITGNTVIDATFNDAMYTLTLYSSPTNGGYTTNGVTPAIYTGGTYPYNTVVTAQALPYLGYAFDRWSDGTLSDNRSFTMVSDISQTAYFVRQIQRYTLKINFNPSEGNVIIMNGSVDVTMMGNGFVYATVNEGTVLTAYVTEILPYSFDRWDDSNSEGVRRVFTMDGDITREVFFADVEAVLCICEELVNSLDTKFGEHFTIYSSNGIVLKRINNVNDRCITLPLHSTVRVSFFPTTEEDHEDDNVVNWDTSDLAGDVFTLGDTFITITLNNETSNLCGRIVSRYCIFVLNIDPPSVLNNKIEFTLESPIGTPVTTQQPLIPSSQYAPSSAYISLDFFPSKTYKLSVNVVQGQTIPQEYQFYSLKCDNTGEEETTQNFIEGTLTPSILRYINRTGYIDFTCKYVTNATSDWFYVENISNTTNNIIIDNQSQTNAKFEYSYDMVSWVVQIVPNGSSSNISFSNSSKVYLRCKRNDLQGIHIGCTSEYNIGGDIMSLLCGEFFTGYETVFNTPTYQPFYGLFKNEINLTNSGSLLLPVMTLVESCYQDMFYGCAKLTTAPVLPATTLAEGCYQSMFYGCGNLTTVPVLPATTLAESCYQSMFYGCTSLTTVPVLPATTLAESCYQSMFGGCTSLTNIPNNAFCATELAKLCYSYMFDGCTSLVNVPNGMLPVTLLADQCYKGMFYGCTSLLGSPELPAISTPTQNNPSGFYESMFSGCSNLNVIRCYLYEPHQSYTLNWITGVQTSYGTFYASSHSVQPGYDRWSTIPPNTNAGIPANWVVQPVNV